MSSPLLISEPPLQVLPRLAKAIGLNEAIILQQIHYWASGKAGRDHDGRRWIYNTVAQWQEQFPFWSESTIQRTLRSLRDEGLIDAVKLSPEKWNHTLYYSINYDNLHTRINQKQADDFSQSDAMRVAFPQKPLRQNEVITLLHPDIFPLPQNEVISNTETTQRLLTETTEIIYALPAELPMPTPSEPMQNTKIKKAAKTSRGTRIAADFTPSTSMLDWARENCSGVDLLTETDKFCDYWRARAGAQAVKMDWQLTWKTWIRTASERLPKSASSNGGGYQRKPSAAERFEQAKAARGAKLASELADLGISVGGVN